MSFRCQECGKPQSNNTRPFAVVTEIRRKVYQHKFGESTGFETAQSKRTCGSCAVKLDPTLPELRPDEFTHTPFAAKLGATPIR